MALQLASLGVDKAQLIDHDVIEASNVTTQGYWGADIGKPKVAALAADMRMAHPNIEIGTHHDRWRPLYSLGEVVFCCVDSIRTRELIWNSVHESVDFWCDGRMLGEVIRVLSAANDLDHEAYKETLFPEEEAERGSCTAQGVIYTAAIAAGLMMGQFTKWLRGYPVDNDLLLDLRSMQLMVDGK